MSWTSASPAIVCAAMRPSWAAVWASHSPPIDVADGVDVRLLRPHPAVDLDDARGRSRPSSSRGRCPRCWRPGRSRRASARRGARPAPCPPGPTIRQMPSSSAVTDAGVEAGVGHDRDAALGEAALDDLADVGVLERHDLRAGTRGAVTLTPRSWYMLANSTPTAPAPTMTMSFGSVSMLAGCRRW